MSEEFLEQLIHAVHVARETRDILKMRKAKLYEEWVEANEELLHEFDDATTVAADAEALLRQAAITQFKTDGRKQVAPGVQVKERLRVTYDYKQALAWAQEKNLCLALDTKAFDTMAKTMKLPFVMYDPETFTALSKTL